MVIPYTHFNFFIANSYQSVDSIEGKLIFDFEEYVKSQVHYNITSDLFEREFKVYANALKALRKKQITSDVYLALGYFYKDISFMVLKSLNKLKDCFFDFDIVVNIKNLTKCNIYLDDIKEQIEDVSKMKKPNKGELGVDVIPFLKLIDDDVLETDIILKEVVCKAAVLYHFSETAIKIEWR